MRRPCRGALRGVLGLVLTGAVLAACAGQTPQNPSGGATSTPSAGASDPAAAAEVTVAPDVAAPAPGPALSPVPPPAAPTGATGSVGPQDAGGGGSTDGFVWSVSQVTAADLPHSWREGCPVPPSALRAVTVGYHSMAGDVRTGVLVLNQDVVAPARAAFARLFELGFPITTIRPVDEFGGDDDRSMAADNTSAFNCRPAVSDGPTSWSKHAYGRAIDLNPLINPYVLNGKVLPPEGARFVDRRPVPGMLTSGSPALRAFTSNGFTWGGTWSNPDYQHLQR